MAIAMTILLWLLAAGLAVLVLAMAMPLRLELVLNKDDAWHFKAALRPFGRFGPRIALSSRKKKADTADKVAHRKRARRRKHRLKPQRFARALIRLVADIFQRVRITAARLDMQFGLGDPGETGQAFGLLAPLIYGTAAIPGMRVNVEPAFDRTVLTGRAELDLSLIPATLLAPSVRFGWSAFGPGR